MRMGINSWSMNILVAMLGVSLCIAAISVINVQKEEKRINQQNHSQIIASIDRLTSQVTPVRLEAPNIWFAGADSGIDYSYEENVEELEAVAAELDGQVLNSDNRTQKTQQYKEYRNPVMGGSLRIWNTPTRNLDDQ